MSITSFAFFVFTAISMVIYYIWPKRYQWIFLLIISIGFYCLAAVPYTIVYILISTFVAYLSTIILYDKRRDQYRHIVIASAIFINVALWFVLRGTELWLPFISCIRVDLLNADIQPTTQLLASLGMSYYTLQAMSYIIDCYWGNISPQKNPFKLLLFLCYFPQLTAGPISRYSQLESIYEEHNFRYENIAFGIQRILWGLVKKLVLAERLAIITGIIANHSESYSGLYSWILILLYPLQIYADFSGCMDIVIGVSELFDIKLVENFNNPFFSRNSQEFWQRWHISLGLWVKDYVLYPLLKSKLMKKLSRVAKSKYGNKAGRKVVNAFGMLVLWITIGIWHGAYRYIIGVSLWYWIILMIEDFLSPSFCRIVSKIHMKTESFGWHLFQSLNVYLLFSFGAAFFCLGIKAAIFRILDALKVILVRGYANPWIIFDDSMLELGVTYGDINIVIFVLVMILIVGMLREKYGSARIWIREQPCLFRWLIWIGLFVLVLIDGKYGPEYDASVFIYQLF